MVDIVGIRFKPTGKTYYFDPLDMDIKDGDNVIVENSHGMENGNVVVGRKQVTESSITKPLKPVLRIATKEDDEHNARNREKEKEAFGI